MIDDDYYYGLAVLLLLLLLLLLSQNTRRIYRAFFPSLHLHFSPKTNSRERTATSVVDRIKRRRLFFCARTTNTNARALFFFSRHVDDD